VLRAPGTVTIPSPASPPRMRDARGALAVVTGWRSRRACSTPGSRSGARSRSDGAARRRHGDTAGVDPQTAARRRTAAGGEAALVLPPRLSRLPGDPRRARSDDSALLVARQVAAESPERVSIAWAHAATPHYANPKVDTLAALVPQAHGEILVFADSDMLVTPSYLRAIVAPFGDPRVGAVTCLYRGRAVEPTLASRLGAIANHQQFAPSYWSRKR